MMKFSLRTKILFSVGVIIFIVLGTSTFVHIQNLKDDYLEALTWRSEALAQDLVEGIRELHQFNTNVEGMLGSLSLHCIKLYELNQDRNITHFAVIDTEGVIRAHNQKELWDTPLDNPRLLEQIAQHQRLTFLDNGTYHTLVPVFIEDDYIATIDVGTPKKLVDKKVADVLLSSISLFVGFLLLAFLTISVLMHVMVTRPVRQLVRIGQQLASGNLVQTFAVSSGGDEIAVLGTVFNRIAHYLANIAEVASHVATGVLDSEVRIRSDKDILGQTIREMLRYLQHIAAIASRVADGDLTENVEARSTSDAFGRAMQTMTEGLRTLIEQIRASANQIAATEQTISSLAANDIGIVKNIYQSSDTMISTFQEMGASVEEVSNNMDALSASVQMTSASVSQMTSSITHIASNTNKLTDQTHQTAEYLESTVQALGDVVSKTDVSKQLSQGTIEEALQGQEAVEQVMSSMETIQQTITTAVQSITEFAKRSEDIDTILEVIREITEQTSLLALNASIIAAQAGEHGRGFAVVADEIKNLASGVGDSTKDIAKIVQTLQQDTQQVVRTIHEGADDVEQGMERTQQARGTLEKIISSAQRSSGVVTEIADTLHDLMQTSQDVSEAMGQVDLMTNDITTATNEQEASTRQIKHAIENVNDMTSQIQRAATNQLGGVQHVLEVMDDVTNLIGQNLESSQQITVTTQELSAQADLLLSSVDRFKLPEGE